MRSKASPSIKKKAREELESEGFLVMGSKGCKGIADLVAIDLNMFRLIQIKSTKSRTTACRMEESIRALSKLIVPINCRKELWTWRGNYKKWKKDVL